MKHRKKCWEPMFDINDATQLVLQVFDNTPMKIYFLGKCNDPKDDHVQYMKILKQ